MVGARNARNQALIGGNIRVSRRSVCPARDHGRMSTIGEGPSGGGDGIVPGPIAVDPFEDGSLQTPNCPACLTRMEPAEAPAGGVYWSCPGCGQTRLA